jgi:outer membrane protein assembly factor BamD (BamD/ComL family)
MRLWPRRLALIAALALIISACAYGPAVITDETTPAEMIQRAQEASDKNRYDLALEYYEALLLRHSDNIELVCTAEYEIAFIHYKQKKYPEAREELNALLERYNTPDEALMPRQFKRLAVIVLERIGEKEKTADPVGDFLMLFKKKENA